MWPRPVGHHKQDHTFHLPLQSQIRLLSRLPRLLRPRFTWLETDSTCPTMIWVTCLLTPIHNLIVRQAATQQVDVSRLFSTNHTRSAFLNPLSERYSLITSHIQDTRALTGKRRKFHFFRCTTRRHKLAGYIGRFLTYITSIAPSNAIRILDALRLTMTQALISATCCSRS